MRQDRELKDQAGGFLLTCGETKVVQVSRQELELGDCDEPKNTCKKVRHV